MIVVVDERELVKDGYASLFGREGIPSTGFDPKEFGEWVTTAADSDIDAVEAFLIGQGESALSLPRAIRDRSQAPVIAMSDTPSLETTLALFDCGVDDYLDTTPIPALDINRQTIFVVGSHNASGVDLVVARAAG